MKNFKVGDKVKSRISGNYGIVTDIDITPMKLFVDVRFSGKQYDEPVPKRYLDYVTPEEWEYVHQMEERT